MIANSPTAVARRLIEMSQQLASQLEMYAKDVQMLHDERARTMEQIARAELDNTRLLQERDVLRARLEKEFQRAELLYAEKGALAVAARESRERSVASGARVRSRALCVGGVAATVALAVVAAPVFS